MRAVFLLPVPSQVRFHKRVEGLTKSGIDASCVYFERDYFEGRPLPVESLSLGRIRHGHYLARILRLLRVVPTVRAHARCADVLYAFGLDMGILALMVRGVRRRVLVVYEVGDVFQYTQMTAISRIARVLERIALKYFDLVVPVTEGFAEEYYVPIQRVDPRRLFVLENKVPAGTSSNSVRMQVPSRCPVMTIGRFGMIRDRISWDILKEVARRGEGRIRVRIHGVFFGLPGWEEDLRENPSLVYMGPYKNPDDLPAVYDGIDMSWVADSSNGGPEARWTRSNRFYEACAFSRPMAVYAHQADGMAARDYDVGVLMDMNDPADCVEQLLSVTDDDLLGWHRNLQSLPRSVFELSDEHERLAGCLLDLLRFETESGKRFRDRPKSQ